MFESAFVCGVEVGSFGRNFSDILHEVATVIHQVNLLGAKGEFHRQEGLLRPVDRLFVLTSGFAACARLVAHFNLNSTICA